MASLCLQRPLGPDGPGAGGQGGRREGGPAGGKGALSPDPRHQVEALLRAAAEGGASDLLLVAGSPPAVRIDGGLSLLPGPALSAADAADLALALLDKDARDQLERRLYADAALTVAGVGRLRVNVHHQGGGLAAAVRLLPARVPDLDSLGLPASVRRLAELQTGLVLVTGPTGAGKSTTLAALVQAIHRHRRLHILTVEQPVEYTYGEGRGLIEQVEVGRDAVSFAQALRAILRQDPDVILVGEMRDPETIALALTAAETGHLVLATLHTRDAVQSVHRVVDAFPAAQQDQVRSQLSLTLACLLSQRLLPGRDGGRVAAAEILWVDDAVRHLIRSRNIHQVRSHMTTSRAGGSITLEAALAELVHAGRIAPDTAAGAAPHPEELGRFLSGGSGAPR